MAKVRLSNKAKVDILEVISFTEKTFGKAKALQYSKLIESALVALAKNPNRGRPRPEIFPYVWTYHIARTGKRARHLFIYRIGFDNVAEIARLLYDGMDLVRHVDENHNGRGIA